MLRLAVAALLSFFLLPAVTAQFQFFGDFFGQQGQQQGHQQEKQNVASDSSWYRQTWETGKPFKNSQTLLELHLPVEMAQCSLKNNPFAAHDKSRHDRLISSL
jgi:hypothetical protein